MLHHYLKKGILPEHILNLSFTEKAFYQASMELEIEEGVRNAPSLA